MRTSATYELIDEPRPGTLARFTVRPVWPLFAVMFASSLFSWSWFVLNAFSMGSPTRKRELLVAAGGVVGSAVLVVVAVAMKSKGLYGDFGLRIALLVVLAWKLVVSYWLYYLQSRTFELYVHYGGTVRNGAFGVAAGWLLMRWIGVPSSALGMLGWLVAS